MKTRLLGPFELSYETLGTVLPKAQGGVYTLGHVDATGTFRVRSVGRDDRDLRSRLQSLIGGGSKFKFAPVESDREAFELECELFHSLRPPANIIHPDRPKESDWQCPVCYRYHR